ncbi:MAG: hypothetical protein OXF63_09080 [Anaerolineaceae bacterium]|nr:hypothetical protein [Anaerolineaceae bacterium]
MTFRRSERPLGEGRGKQPDPLATADLNTIQAPVRLGPSAMTEEQEAP